MYLRHHLSLVLSALLPLTAHQCSSHHGKTRATAVGAILQLVGKIATAGAILLLAGRTAAMGAGATLQLVGKTAEVGVTLLLVGKIVAAGATLVESKDGGAARRIRLHSASR